MEERFCHSMGALGAPGVCMLASLRSVGEQA